CPSLHLSLPAPRAPAASARARACPVCAHVRRPRPRPTLFPYTTLFRSLPSAISTFIDSSPIWIFNVPAPITVSVPSAPARDTLRSEEHTSELQSREKLVCRLLLEKKNT